MRNDCISSSVFLLSPFLTLFLTGLTFWKQYGHVAVYLREGFDWLFWVTCPSLCQSPCHGWCVLIGQARSGVQPSRVRQAPAESLMVETESEVKSLSCVRLFATPWTVAYQAPQSVGFSRQEYWSGLSFPSPDRSDSQGTAIRPAWTWGHLPLCQ